MYIPSFGPDDVNKFEMVVAQGLDAAAKQGLDQLIVDLTQNGGVKLEYKIYMIDKYNFDSQLYNIVEIEYHCFYFFCFCMHFDFVFIFLFGRVIFV
jgi:hypothetical protein